MVSPLTGERDSCQLQTATGLLHWLFIGVSIALTALLEYVSQSFAGE